MSLAWIIVLSDSVFSGPRPILSKKRFSLRPVCVQTNCSIFVPAADLSFFTFIQYSLTLTMRPAVAGCGLHIGNIRYILRLKTIRKADASRSFRRTSNEMDIDAIHKALANPLRREILEWLKEPERHFP